MAFASYADDLLSGDLGTLGGVEEVYVRDMATGDLRRISVNAAGVMGSDNSFGPAITADAAHVVFAASAPNLDDLDTNDAVDVFVHEPAGPAFPPPPADQVAPNTTITSGPASTLRATSATFAFTSNEPGSTFQCKLDTGAWASCTSPTTRTGLAKGKHTFSVRATDASGNVDATPAAWSFSVRQPQSARRLPRPGRFGRGSRAPVRRSADRGRGVRRRRSSRCAEAPRGQSGNSSADGVNRRGNAGWRIGSGRGQRRAWSARRRMTW